MTTFSTTHVSVEELDELFQDAAELVQTAVTSGRTAGNDEMLELYGLYKQATEGDCKVSRPSFLNFKARAKWEAWKKLEGTSSQKAKAGYIATMQQLFGEEGGESKGKSGPAAGGPVISTLLSADEDTESSGMTRIHRLAMAGSVDDLRSEIERGANPDERDSEGSTALHYAADKGTIQVMRVLLQHGASVNLQNEDGATPLHFAALGNQEQAAHLLIDSGADCSIVDADNCTAEDVAFDSSKLWFRTSNPEGKSREQR